MAVYNKKNPKIRKTTRSKARSKRGRAKSKILRRDSIHWISEANLLLNTLILLTLFDFWNSYQWAYVVKNIQLFLDYIQSLIS